MIETPCNFAAIKEGRIPITPQEQAKLKKDGLDVLEDIYRYAKLGFEAIEEDDFDRLKWYGVYRQKPKDSGFFLLRTKVPGGQINAAQAACLQKIADDFAHGLSDITTRQTIQFHWLKIEDIPEIFARLAAVGMTTTGACGDDPRNVCGCPVTSINPDEIIDASAQLAEINQHLTNNRAFSNLPRKFKVSISGCHLHCTQPDINCLGFFGLLNAEGIAGYGVKVGGGLSSAPHLAQTLPVWIAPDQVWPVTQAVAEIFREEGYRDKRNRSRFKFLVADWGVERVLSEIETRIGYSLQPHTDFTFPSDQETDHLGIHEQKQKGLYWVGVSIVGGRFREGILGAVGILAKKYCIAGGDSIRLSNKQNLLIVNVPEANLEALKADLAVLGLQYEPSNFRSGCVSCTGIEFCNLAVTETKNRMIALVEELEAQSGWYKGKLRVHFSGCPSSCGQHQIADIGFRGAKTKVDGTMRDAFDLFVGGRLGANRRFNHLLKGKVLATDIAAVIDSLLLFFDKNHLPEETFSSFCERLPKEELIEGLPTKYQK